MKYLITPLRISLFSDYDHFIVEYDGDHNFGYVLRGIKKNGEKVMLDFAKTREELHKYFMDGKDDN